MPKTSLFRRTAKPPIEPEILQDTDESTTTNIIPFRETFPGAMPLSDRERRRFSELEGVISKNMASFLDFIYALREIRDSRFYRETHADFDSYCKEKWEMTRQHADRCVNAADVIDEVKKIDLTTFVVKQDEMTPIGVISENKSIPIPKNECQARALVKLKDNPEKLRQVWIETVKSAPEGRITANHIRLTARRMSTDEIKEITNRAKKETERTAKMDPEFRAAFDEYLNQINIARETNWKHTDKELAIRFTRALVSAMEATAY